MVTSFNEMASMPAMIIFGDLSYMARRSHSSDGF
jgi:hypothetical protein